MTVRFASANHPVRRLGWRAAGRGLLLPARARAANDNGPVEPAPARFDPVLIEALRHFAVHGLASVESALKLAAEAAARGDAEARDHWRSIARMFDGRFAARARRALIQD
ncbi:MAG: hypothetical protein ACKO1N_11860 [Erythrobacter sp.]